MLLWELHRSLSLAIADDPLITIPADFAKDGVRYSSALRSSYLLLGTMDYLNSIYKNMAFLPKKKKNIALEVWFSNEILQVLTGTTIPPAFHILNARDVLGIIPIFNPTELNNFNNPISSQREQRYVNTVLNTIVGASTSLVVNYLPLPAITNYDTTLDAISTTLASKGTTTAPYCTDDRHTANIISYAALRAYMDDQEIGSPERFSQFTINTIGNPNANNVNQ